MDEAWQKYLVVNAADWLLIGLLGWTAVTWLEAPWWSAAAVLAAWIVKDLLMFRSMRWFYVDQPADRRMVGMYGMALSRLEPHGFVRVRGEIWQARLTSRDQTVSEGGSIRVCDVRGLNLLVEQVESSAAAPRDSST